MAKKSKDNPTPPAPVSPLDETIHQQTRLAIMCTLAGVEALEFNDLKGQLGLSDGNLSTHAATLERKGYVKIDKGFRGRKPVTTLRVTPKGRTALEHYIEHLNGILGQVPER